MAGTKSHMPITEDDLRCLQAMGLQAHEEILARNPNLEVYRDRLRLVCLRQSAARHYADERFTGGFGDFDIWLFYEADPSVIFSARGRVRKNRPRYAGKDVDVLRRAVPIRGSTASMDEVVAAILSYIERRRRDVAKSCRKPDALVGLYPSELLGKVLWLSAD